MVFFITVLLTSPIEVTCLTIGSSFSPWQVSEPQKWGYPADLKKILVYFFGTQQM